ncbi:hypothetical protein KOW79_018235 [Hemibagrus wyckioides]|uniref:Uncharacterized protein n=1 Tax=Hemibagrus wyckioides TaxID=337641 RepID=A0A9D3NCF4_9TELE|nr:hypothetical protein KOW79_018235 [Hemibagrus wyckioides]
MASCGWSGAEGHATTRRSRGRGSTSEELPAFPHQIKSSVKTRSSSAFSSALGVRDTRWLGPPVGRFWSAEQEDYAQGAMCVSGEERGGNRGRAPPSVIQKRRTSLLSLVPLQISSLMSSWV